MSYSFDSVRKFALAFALFLGTGLAYFLHYDPGFGQALEVLVATGFAAAGVFLAPQFSEQDFSKALTAFTGALIGVINFFHQVNATTELRVYTLLGMGVSVFAIWWVSNKGHLTPLRK